VFQFTEATSFMVECETQEKIDYYWDRLLAGGEPSQCGWLKDRYGLSWQVVPKILAELIGSSDRAKAERATAAMMKMVKLDIETLKKAYDGV
jgi:predicted 3-demethylubiquinone-9 3-methyltransferase (glyoxalase superfamily)